jgi:stress-induced morphogen
VTSVFPLARLTPGMDLADIEALIEESIPDADATVSRARGADDDDHLAATVVSPAFANESLVDRHQMVYDALGDRMTTDIHALEVETHTPEERD